MAQIEINYGALSAPIEDQLNKQGFTLGKKAEFIEEMAYGLVLNYVHSILTYSEYDRAIQRLHKNIISQITPINGGVD